MAEGSESEIDDGRPPSAASSNDSKPVDAASQINPWTAVVQIAGLLAIVVVVIFDLRTDGEPVPALVYGTLAGIALGIDPSNIKPSNIRGAFRAK